MSYQLARQYTGQSTNVLSIDLIDAGSDTYTFSVASDLADVSVEEGAELTLENQTVTFSYATEGVYSADFKVNRGNGTPFIYEILTWEYSLERPPEPIISFGSAATRSQVVQLLVSDSRPANVTDIWLTGDISNSGKAEIEDGGYWDSLATDAKSSLLTLTPGDGVKRVEAKLRNIFGNTGETGVPAEIILKQTPPTGCDAVPISPIIGDNKVSLKMSATDPFQVYYSVFGDVKAVVNQTPFSDGDVVYVFVEPSPGAKTISVSITDIAGNDCLQKTVNVTLDPDFESEGIFVTDHLYWTDTENITIDVLFEHFPDQEPLQLKITGDVFGDKTHDWIPYQTDIPITLNPSTSGNRRIYAQYKDAQGQESYLLAKRIFLKPTVTLQDAGAPFQDVIASNILDAPTLSISGCNETYNNVAWQAAFVCEPNAVTVDVTWHLKDGSQLTRSASP